MIQSVSIITKNGAILLTRQYREMSRGQIEGNLGAFTKLIQTSSESYIESESIRYVYRELGESGLFLILITSKESNILEDMELLQLLDEAIRKQVDQIDEDSIRDASLDLILAFDEFIFNGFRETVTVDQVMTFLKMESAAEQDAIASRKMMETMAANQMKDRLKEIEKQKKTQMGVSSTGKYGAVTGTVSVSSVGSSSYGSTSFGSESMGESQPANSYATSYSSQDEVIQKPSRPAAKKIQRTGKGTSLKRGSKSQRAREMLQEDDM